MSDKGIIFSAPMVRALLAGRKTQTRRLFKARFGMGEPMNLREHGIGEYSGANNDATSWGYPCAEDGCDMSLAHWPYLSGYSAGDRLYVRESWRVSPEACEGWHPDHLRGWIDYQAGGSLEVVAPSIEAAERATFLKTEDHDWDFIPSRYRPCIHMPRWASRLWLAATDVRVQRLQDISEDDCIAEGPKLKGWMEGLGRPLDGWMVETEQEHVSATPRFWYRELWDSLHTAEGTTWEANPWVVAVSFDVHQGNIDSRA